MKSVCIIGGGPAGLVAAKTLLKWPGNPYNVTLYEAADRVGGMWRGRKGDKGTKCSPDMRTNLSRFTVAFSDLPWQAVALDAEDGYTSKALPPMFPKAYQVSAYLEEYASKFIPKDVIQCNRKVISAQRNGSPPRWTITTQDTQTGSEQSSVFDKLIIASGFFDQPNRSSEQASYQVQHSADFRDVSWFGDEAGNIVVVGGGISGSEAAATAAFQISSARYSPGGSKPAWSESKIYHVFDRPFYVLPRYVSPEPCDTVDAKFKSAPTFLPVDINLYNLARRGPDDIVAINGLVPPERAPKTHDFIRSMLGGDNSEFGHRNLVFSDEQKRYPPYTGIADTYSEFVRSGLIIPVQGRAMKTVEVHGKMDIKITQDGKWTTQFPFTGSQPDCISNVTGVIEATGYRCSLDYLADDVRTALDHDPQCRRVPFLLSEGSTFAPKVPDMAFVGFYEGPYWAVMEAQARLIAQTWLGDQADKSYDVSLPIKVREGLARRDLSVPQFWMADYVGLVEELGREAGTQRNDGCFDGQTGPLFPARYTTKGSDLNAAETTVREIRDLLDASETGGRFVATAAFRAMQGKWSLHRKIISRNASAPGGKLEGEAHFHPREPTAPLFSAEYLYIEEGTFTMDNGFTFPAKRRYIYRYSEVKDTITAWFVQEDGETAEKFFNELVFERSTDDERKGWIAKGEHWCEPDMYRSGWEFCFRGVGLEKLGISYEVKGPSKDYTHESWYRR